MLLAFMVFTTIPKLQTNAFSTYQNKSNGSIYNPPYTPYTPGNYAKFGPQRYSFQALGYNWLFLPYGYSATYGNTSVAWIACNINLDCSKSGNWTSPTVISGLYPSTEVDTTATQLTPFSLWNNGSNHVYLIANSYLYQNGTFYFTLFDYVNGTLQLTPSPSIVWDTVTRTKIGPSPFWGLSPSIAVLPSGDVYVSQTIGNSTGTKNPTNTTMWYSPHGDGTFSKVGNSATCFSTSLVPNQYNQSWIFATESGSIIDICAGYAIGNNKLQYRTWSGSSWSSPVLTSNNYNINRIHCVSHSDILYCVDYSSGGLYQLKYVAGSGSINENIISPAIAIVSTISIDSSGNDLSVEYLGTTAQFFIMYIFSSNAGVNWTSPVAITGNHTCVVYCDMSLSSSYYLGNQNITGLTFLYGPSQYYFNWINANIVIVTTTQTITGLNTPDLTNLNWVIFAILLFIFTSITYFVMFRVLHLSNVNLGFITLFTLAVDSLFGLFAGNSGSVGYFPFGIAVFYFSALVVYLIKGRYK